MDDTAADRAEFLSEKYSEALERGLQLSDRLREIHDLASAILSMAAPDAPYRKAVEQIIFYSKHR